MFKVYTLEFFLFVLKNAVAEDQVWPAISLSADEIDRDVYDHTSGIACEVSYTMANMSRNHCTGCSVSIQPKKTSYSTSDLKSI